MRRALSMLVALLLVAGFATGAGRGVSAQASGKGTVIYDSSGNQIATVSVDSVTQDFKGADEGYEPDRGFQYDLVTFTITNTGDSTYSLQSYAFELVDTDGFISQTAYISYADGVAAPQLQDQDIDPGDSVTGALAFEIISGSKIGSIIYVPEYDQTYILASGPKVDGSTPLTLFSDDGSPVGTLTVGKIHDPLDGVDPSSPAPRGYRYIGVEVTIKNTSNRPLSVDPSSLEVIDAQGFVETNYGAYRTDDAESALPDLESGDLAPNDSASGLVTYTVFSDSDPAWLVWTDGSTVFQIALTFDSAPAVPAVSSIPAGAAGTPVAGTSTETTSGNDETSAATPAANLSPECQAISTWANQVDTAISKLNNSDNALDIESESDLENLTVDQLNAQIDDANDFLDTLAGLDTPDGAQDTEKALANAINTEVNALQAAVDAKNSGGDLNDVFSTWEPKVEAASAAFTTAAGKLVETCPDLTF